MDITDIREHVEIMWTLANNFLRSNTDRKCFHGISYSEMMKMEKALRITVGILRHMERKHLERHPMDSASDQAEP